jgi:hypothetical protein
VHDDAFDLALLKRNQTNYSFPNAVFINYGHFSYKYLLNSEQLSFFLIICKLFMIG